MSIRRPFRPSYIPSPAPPHITLRCGPPPLRLTATSARGCCGVSLGRACAARSVESNVTKSAKIYSTLTVCKVRDTMENIITTIWASKRSGKRDWNMMMSYKFYIHESVIVEDVYMSVTRMKSYMLNFKKKTLFAQMNLFYLLFCSFTSMCGMCNGAVWYLKIYTTAWDERREQWNLLEQMNTNIHQCDQNYRKWQKPSLRKMYLMCTLTF